MLPLKRKAIPRLLDISRSDLKDLCYDLKRCNFEYEPNVSIKFDGFGLRFGYDELDDFFFETSRSGPIYNNGDILEFTTKRGGNIERAKHYENLMALLQHHTIYNLYVPKDTKIVCEILYTPMGIEDGYNKLKFVNTSYDKDYLGSEATLIILDILNCNNEIHKDAEKIKRNMLLKSNSKVKFIDPMINVGKLHFSYIRNYIDLKDDFSYNCVLALIKRKIFEKIFFAPERFLSRDVKSCEGFVVEFFSKKYKILV